MKKNYRLFIIALAAVLTLTLSSVLPAEAAPRALGGFFKQVRQYNDMDLDAGGEYELFHQTYAGLGVKKEIRDTYPRLAEALEKISRQEWERAQEVRQKMKAEAAGFRQEAPDRYHPFEHEMNVLMCRADTFAVSFLQKEYAGGAGVHGMYGWEGVTLSTATGAPIALDAIVKDKQALTKAICAQLRTDYQDRVYAEMEQTVAEMAEKDMLNWTLDPRGITFYFNPYGIAPYAAGLLTATILFRESPELFHNAYIREAPSYAQPFTAAYDLTVDLNDTGHRSTVYVYPFAGTIHLVLNGREMSFPVALTDLEPVFIHLEDGRNYLYIDGKEQDKSTRKTLVLQLEDNSAHQIELLPYSFRHTIAVSPAVQEYWNFLTDPNGFYFDQSSGFTSSSKTDICSVSERGTLSYG